MIAPSLPRHFGVPYVIPAKAGIQRAGNTPSQSIIPIQPIPVHPAPLDSGFRRNDVETPITVHHSNPAHPGSSV